MSNLNKFNITEATMLELAAMKGVEYEFGTESAASLLDYSQSLLAMASSQSSAVVYPPDGTISPFTVINLGGGMVKIGDSLHDNRLPALWFGKDGLGIGVEEVMNRKAVEGETLAVVTFANVEGLDVLLEVINRIRGIAFPDADEKDGVA